MPEQKEKLTKAKYGFWLREDVNQLIEDHKHIRGNDRSAFITDAVRAYCAELDGERNLDVLCNRMYKIISAEADCHSNRMATLLFKIAVELAILNHMISAGYINLTEQEMRYIRNKAITSVRKSHGFISFEQALDDERADIIGN